MAPANNDQVTEAFPQFARLPPEIRLEIWRHYLMMYKDNPPVLWKIIWGLDDTGVEGTIKQKGWEKHIRIRPYISFDGRGDHTDFAEYHCCPLLKINHEAREQALRSRRYASVPVMGRHINVVVRAHDFFLPDEESVFRVVYNWEGRHGPLVSITLADDMSFVRRVLVSMRDVITKFWNQGNWTFSATPPSLHDFSWGRWGFSLTTIARTYLRNVEKLYADHSANIKRWEGMSGTRRIAYACRAESPGWSVTARGRVVSLARKIIKDRTSRFSPAAWSIVSRLHEQHDAFLLPISRQNLGEVSPTDGVYVPDVGPEFNIVACPPAMNCWHYRQDCTTELQRLAASRRVKTTKREDCIADLQRLAASRPVETTEEMYAIHLPMWVRLECPGSTTTKSPSISYPARTSPRIPSTLPLRERPQGRLLKVVGTGDGNFFRERLCYSPILAVGNTAGLRMTSPGSMGGGRGCPRCLKKQWLITGSKPTTTTVCRESSCWVSHYTYDTSEDWDLSGSRSAILQSNADKTDRGPKVKVGEKEFEVESYNSDDESAVVEHGRTEGLRAWWKAVDSYMDDEDLIDKIVKNEMVVKKSGLFRGPMKSSWKDRPKRGGSEDGEERVLFWDEVAEKDPGVHEEEIKVMEWAIREAYGVQGNYLDDGW
ncbi:hypothetical protein QBC41DRAFT_382582 [Cercophora samala]|uniref:2EXR domain-containing protein n=1 Tax=Cercophora samala TaxID=330535 RepID=A0AA39ZJA9_9PEZI|nr:hypothetical protein QBC41DRAFT_382582 [Cercophora samala]